ncbi:hypothetical protein ABT173_40095 [Streptomyces sp. NPDC001795]|uniref:hypothetical protein n=1 Tax=unclassified Streptomyces TaxID=2593676 RepID=UPI0033226356
MPRISSTGERGPALRRVGLASIHPRTPESPCARGEQIFVLPGRRRVWAEANLEDTRLLSDLALSQDSVSSNTLAGIELSAQDIPVRMLEFSRIVAVRDAEGAHSNSNAQEEAKNRTLKRYFRECGTSHVTGARVTVYVRKYLACSAAAGL